MRIVLPWIAAVLALPLSGCGAGAPQGPARLVLASAGVDVGGLPAGTSREVEVRWRRVGRGPLRVLAVESDCGCACAQGPAGDLARDTSGVLRVAVHGRGRPGPFRATVRIYTSAAPPHDVVRWTVRGWSGAPLVARPEVLDLGPRSPRAEADGLVEVRWARDPGALQAVCAGVPGRVTVEPSAVVGRDGCLLRIAVTLPPAPGPVRGEVVVLAEGIDVLRVPLRAEVRARSPVRRPLPARPGRAPPR